MSDAFDIPTVDQWLPTREIRLDFVFDPKEHPMREDDRWELITLQVRVFFLNLCADLSALMEANADTISDEDMGHLLWCQQQVQALMEVCVKGKASMWDRVTEGIAEMAARLGIKRREEVA